MRMPSLVAAVALIAIAGPAYAGGGSCGYGANVTAQTPLPAPAEIAQTPIPETTTVAAPASSTSTPATSTDVAAATTTDQPKSN